MSLQDYLTKYFPNGPIGEFESQKCEIISHFIDRFGVNVKNVGNLYLFKYDQLLVKFTIPLTKECRGHIYQYINGNWLRVCNAMDKFWNFDEGFCPIFEESEFQQYINQIELKNKEDGSLIHLYWLEDQQKWNLSTSGSIVCFTVGDSSLTFDQLFWKTLNKDVTEFTSKLDKNYVYIFELCSTLNQIVSMYKNDRIYLLNVRHNRYGTYLPIDSIAQELGLLIPTSTFLYQLDINTKNDMVMWVEKNCVDDVDCKNKEGFVGYINGVPSFKIKTNRYKFLHSFKGNNEKETRNNIIDAYFTDTIDDVYNDLHESSKMFVESLRIKVLNLLNDVNLAIVKMNGLKFETQKEYALFVIANTPKMVNGFFFANKEIILKSEGITELFTNWIKQHHKKYEDYWKS
jgi:T4 RnlA family RNA ligase